MLGKIRFFKTVEKFGFISSKEAGREIFFHENSIEDRDLRRLPNEEVEFDLVESRRKAGALEAVRVRRPSGASSETANGGDKIFSIGPETHPSEYLFEWAFIALDDKPSTDSTIKYGALHELAEMALKENWTHGAEDVSNRGALPILKNYLVNTFYKQYIDGNVAESNLHEEKWATFNTGLVNKLYNPIYALFQRNTRGRRPWKFHAFCNANIGRAGQTLVQHFSSPPPAPKYFKSADEVVFDPSIPIIPRYDHIVDDSITRGRYPFEFLRQHVPEGFVWQDPLGMNESDRSSFLQDYTAALKNDSRAERNIHHRLDDAIELAVKRARWNYQTAIPLYFPRKNSICHLLPISLVDDDKVDLALIVSRTISGGYSGETVYPLNWAYEHARLVCKPDSNWLTATGQTATTPPIKPPEPAAPTRGPASPSVVASAGEFIRSDSPNLQRKIACPQCSQVYWIDRSKLVDLPRGATCRACGSRFTIHPE